MSSQFRYPQIDLNRRFLSIEEADPEDEPGRAMLLAAKGEEVGVAWPDLLDLDATVVLAEAGAGKTAEFRRKAGELRAAGCPAFVLRIESLCERDIATSFDFDDSGGPAAYQAWRQKRGEAVFFLDALDEARLPEGRNNAGLADALRQLEKEIGNRGKQVRLVISSRGSEWRGQIDQALVAQTLRLLRSSPRLKRDERPEPRLGVFRLARLDHRRVAAIATSRGVNPDAFMKSVNEAQAADLVRTPLETHFLLDIWLDGATSGHGSTFSSRTDVFDRVIDFRLQDATDDERRVSLSLEKMRRGAERLATASLLMSVRDIRVGSFASDELDAALLLGGAPDPWQQNEVRQLLSTALFHPAIGGRIRFAHRELQDFLAARFFTRAMRVTGGGIDAISPLFSQGMGQRFIPDDTAKVLGWLATMNAEACREVTRIEPTLLITTGDPKSLSIENRAAALRSHVKSYGDRRYRGDWFFTRDVERFASPELAPAVARLLDESTAPEAQVLLVRLALHGRMESIADRLTKIAADPAKDMRVRASAANAIALFGSADNRRSLLESARAEPSAESPHAAVARNELVLGAIEAAYDVALDLKGALSLVAALEREPANLSTNTGDRLASIVIMEGDVKHWLPGLLALAADTAQLSDDGLPAVVERYRVLATAIAACVTQLLNDNVPYETMLRSAIEYLTHIGEDIGYYRHGDAHKAFRLALARRSDVKSALFLERAASSTASQFDAACSATGPWLHQPHFMKDRILTLADVRELSQVLENAPDERLAAVAFEIAFRVSTVLPRADSESARRLLMSAARRSRSAEIQRRGRPRSVLQRVRAWRLRPRFWRYRVRGVARQSWEWCKSFYYILRHRGAIHRGTDWNGLVCAARQEPNNLGQSVIETVRKSFGRLAASWFESGFRAAWRCVPLPKQGTPNWSTYIAITGLALEASDGPLTVNDELAGRAFQFAVEALNSFPSWVEDLAVRHPEVFREVVRDRIADEVKLPASEHGVAGRALGHVYHGPQSLRNLVAADVLLELERSETPNARVLEHALVIVASAQGAAPERVAALARDRFVRAAGEGSWSRAWLWLCTWLRVDALAAWAEVERWDSGIWPPGDAHPLFGFFADLGESFSFGGAWGERAEFLRLPDVLRSMVRKAYLLVSPETDPNHESVFSPDRHDHAVGARRTLRDSLAVLGTQEARDALLALADDGELTASRDEFLTLADLVARRSAVRRLLTLDDAVRVIRGAEPTPATPAEFAERVRAHIESALRLLRDGDDDEGRGLRQGRNDEDDLRNWLSGRLRDLGEGAYEPIRDQLVANSKRPDIRIPARLTELGRVSVECKIAENWSGEELLSRIQTQLVDQYMREFNSHSGVYVVVRCQLEERQGWRVEGNLVAFDQLLDRLREQARSIRSARADIVRLEVLGIDLTTKSVF